MAQNEDAGPMMLAIDTSRRNLTDTLARADLDHFKPSGSVSVALVGTTDMYRGRVDLKAGTTKIGRSDATDLQIPHKSVSRHHATVSYDREQRTLRIKDNESFNGTFINHRRVSDAPLGDGDCIHLSPYIRLLVVAQGLQEEQTAIAVLHDTQELPAAKGELFTVEEEDCPTDMGIGPPVVQPRAPDDRAPSSPPTITMDPKALAGEMTLPPEMIPEELAEEVAREAHGLLGRTDAAPVPSISNLDDQKVVELERERTQLAILLQITLRYLSAPHGTKPAEVLFSFAERVVKFNAAFVVQGESQSILSHPKAERLDRNDYRQLAEECDPDRIQVFDSPNDAISLVTFHAGSRALIPSGKDCYIVFLAEEANAYSADIDFLSLLGQIHGTATDVYAQGRM